MNGKFCDLYNEHVKNKICKKKKKSPLKHILKGHPRKCQKKKE